MLTAIQRLPLVLVGMIAGAVLMLLPAIYAAQVDDWRIARTFLYHAIFFLMLATMLGIGTAGRLRDATPREQLLSLIAAYFTLPVMLALPLAQVLPAVTLAQAYFEMLSAFTTTGATIFADPTAVAAPLHLWRALVGWMGGLVFLVAALAILEPLRLGGFEIQATVGTVASGGRLRRGTSLRGNERFFRVAGQIAVPYTVLTVALIVGLTLAGESGFVAVCHAMSVLATSGITPLRSFAGAEAGYTGEVIVFAFLFFAVSQKGITMLFSAGLPAVLRADPEIRLALACVIIVPALLFLRHFIAAIDVAEQENAIAALRALWGSAFNVMSYLTTTGFDSRDWGASRDWSGLSTPGLILLALCTMGGGIATTAGGVKLLRVYALYKHSGREMARLVHPSSVGGAGSTARHVRRQGATIAWIFLMLFMIGIALSLLALTLAGQGFEAALALSIAALTNTGPAMFLLGTRPDLALASDAVRAILCVVMVLGRLETLVVIALFNPGNWRA